VDGLHRGTSSKNTWAEFPMPTLILMHTLDPPLFPCQAQILLVEQ